MNPPADAPARSVNRWTTLYTAGLPGSIGAERRAEIASDAADHRRARLDDAWSERRIARERLWRTLRGALADLAWRYEILATGSRANATTRGAVVVVASAASLAVAAFHTAFAAYLLGADHLADRPLLGRLGSYAEEVDSGAAPVAAGIILALGVLILVAGLVRPVAPLAANVATMAIAIWSVLWFWLGAAPLGIIAVAAAITDMVLRAPALRSST